MSDFNPMVKTLPELPFTGTLRRDNLLWIHQEHDTTDRHTTFEAMFGQAFDILPFEANVTVIGSSSRRFKDIHSANVHVGTATLSEISGILHVPTTQVGGNLIVDGNLTIMGESTAINVETVAIKDNIIEVNSNQQGVPLETLRSGIEVNRGNEVNYQFIFAENSKTFRVGEVGSTQAVATREDSPVDGGVAVWNAVSKRFEAKSSFSGTIEAASRLATPRRITLSGSLTGFQDFDGSGNITISAAVNNDSHTHDLRYHTKEQADARYLELNKAETITQGLTINGVLNVTTIVGTSFSGNAATASKLQTARTIALAGDVVGSALFDGTAGGTTINVTIPDVGVGGHKHDAQYYPRAEAKATFVSISQVGEDADAIIGNLSIDGNVTAATFRGPEHGKAILDGNALTANNWKEMMTITLNGDAEGAVEFNGASNRILNVTVKPNSHSHDAQYYTKEIADSRFLNIQSSEDDKIQGNLALTGTVIADSGFRGDVDGNASTATRFNRAQIVNVIGGATGTVLILGDEDPISLSLTITNNSHSHVSANISDATAANTPSTVVLRDENGSFAGTSITANTFIGNVQGNVTGDVIGDVTGNLTGNVTGDVTGNLTGDVQGSLTGDVTGNVIGNVTGNVVGDVTGKLTGNVQGNVTGDLTGNVTGALTGNVQGNVVGNVTGNASTATKLQTARTISISDGATGSIPFDGSSNVSIPLIVNPNMHTHSDIYYRTESDSTFVKKAGDTINGNLTITNGKLIGTATLAERLATSRAITLGGHVYGSASFNGSENIAINVAVNRAQGVPQDGGKFSFVMEHDAEVAGALTVRGDLFVQGATSTIKTQDLEVTDNFITVNKGATTWSASSETGIEFNRGPQANYQIKVVGDVVRLGTATESQAIATREDSPIANAPVIWNASSRRFDTVSPSTEIAATVTNAKHSQTTTALASPQTITLNGGIDGSFIVGDNAGNKIVNVTVNKVGAANTADALTSPQTITFNGGIEGNFIIGDNAGNKAVTVTVNKVAAAINADTAAQADKLKTARNIELTGVVTGNNSFDGSGAIQIATVLGSGLSTRLTTIESNINTNASNIVTNTSSINTLVSADTALAGRILDLEIVNSDARITATEGRLNTVEEDILGIESAKADKDDPRFADARPPIAHSHAIADIYELETELSTKANVNHTHSIDSVNNLQFELNNKAPNNHEHVIEDIQDLANQIARIQKIRTTAPANPQDGDFWIA
jgi:hypothetical protein